MKGNLELYVQELDEEVGERPKNFHIGNFISLSQRLR